MTLSVRVHVGGWESKASFDELRTQAEREARKSLAHHLQNTNIK